MMIMAVVNTKGGSGKTTLATHLAAHFARRGLKTGLADLDPQQSANGWLTRRPYTLPAIAAVDLENDNKPPKGLDRLVADAPAALKRKAVADVVETADVLVIPVLPSIFDEDGTIRFLKHLDTLKAVRKGKRDTQTYANLAVEGGSLFDVPSARPDDYRAEWRTLLDYLDNCMP